MYSPLPIASFNGRLIRSKRLRISPLGDGFMFGQGAFETIKVVAGQAHFLADHLARLRPAGASVGLPMRGADREWKRRCERVIAANRLGDGSLKIVVFRDEAGVGELIIARRGLYPAETYARGFRLRLQAGDRAGAGLPFKTLNYLPNRLARSRAVAEGFDETLFVDPRAGVLEGSGTSLFAVMGGRIVTPPLSQPILRGTARARVLRLLGPGRAREGPLPLARLLAAREVFVTNALLGVMPVSRIGRRRYDLRRNPVTRALMAAYAAAEAAEASQRRARPAKKSTAGA